MAHAGDGGIYSELARNGCFAEPESLYPGVLTLIPLLTGKGREHHGEILLAASQLAESGEVKPLLSEGRFTTNDIAAPHLEPRLRAP